MRAVVQKVSRAQVTVDDALTGAVERGLLVLVGAATDDTSADAEFLARKVVGLRVFEDEEGKINLDLAAVGGAVLAVSQFTLLGDCRKGRRPSFVQAARPEVAEPLFDQFVAAVRAQGVRCETGRFRTHMMVELVNDGPVTLL
ncbi:MAG: D-tyrosyl-tRNA(Tyr) deacylase, partial [Myxococcales bacterium]|nr:D-tyrosyl-tRNA(Tyr) deacylase [Myxococcales bacterium]